MVPWTGKRLGFGYGRRSRPKRTKKQNERAHAKRRCRERYGIELNKAKMREIADIIQSRDKKRVQSFKNSPVKDRHIYRVKLEDRWLIVVYDKKNKVPVTFLRKPPKRRKRIVKVEVRRPSMSIRARRRARGRAREFSLC